MARAVKQSGYPMVLCFVIHRDNIDRIEDMLRLAVDLQADYVELATTEYYGSGRSTTATASCRPAPNSKGPSRSPTTTRPATRAG